MFSATNGGEGCLEGKKEGEPLFPRIRILQKFVFRSNGAVLRSAKRNSDGRRRVCRMVLSFYFRAGIRGHGITFRPVKIVVHFCEELEGEEEEEEGGSPIGCVRGKNKK